MSHLNEHHTNISTFSGSEEFPQPLYDSSFEMEEFLDLIPTGEIPDDRKAEFLAALWSIILAFVDLGYNIDPTNLAYYLSFSRNDNSPDRNKIAQEESPVTSGGRYV